MSQECVPNKDFVFVYSVDSYEEPSHVLGRTDTSQSVMLSFIPKFHKFSASEAYDNVVHKKEIEYEMESARA